MSIPTGGERLRTRPDEFSISVPVVWPRPGSSQATRMTEFSRPTSSPGTSPTAATSPASIAISTPAPSLSSAREFADRSELGTEECFKVIEDLAAFAPECVTILTGGEPLLRRDILEIVQRAAERGLWVVVGTNGVRITENVARRLAEAGARGLSCLSTPSIPIVTIASGTSAGPGRTRSKEPRSSTEPGSRSSCRRLPARTTSASSKRSPICARSTPREGLEPGFPGPDPGAGSSFRTSRRRSTTTCSHRYSGSRESTRGGCW